MTQDGGLRALIRKHLPSFHWVAVETGGTGRGILDDNFCAAGIEGWVEYKVTGTMAVPLRPEQVGWIERRIRAGGRTFILVRRQHAGGVRRGPPVDEVWLFPGRCARALLDHGLPIFHLEPGDSEIGNRHCEPPAVHGSGGPAKWPWHEIEAEFLR